LYLGLSMTERDSKTISYLKEIGFSDPTYQLGSKSRLAKNKIAENKLISSALPSMVSISKGLAEKRHPDDKTKQHLMARKLIREAAGNLREEFNDPDYGSSSQVAIIVDTLSRLNEADRKYGIVMFKENNNGRLPDIGSLSDMAEYAQYAATKYFSD